MNTRGPAPKPCASCPYRRDVPSGVWHPDEYTKLRRYDEDTSQQPAGLFICHQTDAENDARRVCAGWVGCHGDQLLGLAGAPEDDPKSQRSGTWMTVRYAMQVGRPVAICYPDGRVEVR